MDSKSLIGIIDISSENIKCVIFGSNNEGSKEVISSSFIKSQGINNCKIEKIMCK